MKSIKESREVKCFQRGHAAERPLWCGDSQIIHSSVKRVNTAATSRMEKAAQPKRMLVGKSVKEQSRCCSGEEALHGEDSVSMQFHSQLPSVSSAEIEEQLDRISDLYRCINQYLYTDPLLHSMDPYGGQQEREGEQTLERCQETLPSLLQHIQQLKDAATLWMKLGSCWRPAFKACRDSGSGCAPLLLYSSLQELKEMDTLRFHVQTLQQQIHIQRVMAEELLPVVFSSESPEQPQFHLYRAAYSLLCEGGEQFPVLVLDNISD
ncbi:tubulin epsilon and delta complex protein 2 isoform X1 [Pristis pectinata]|uniref:tubulin epsilon and delta complex protein 2 isoform X1 n=1 Tax=Pristis pectinata TaxID=685728 RepID=UPI00223DEE3F|nr:tubulin epsilon and delta complex protein 2 isoform X1 [Pristis pectinata]